MARRRGERSNIVENQNSLSDFAGSCRVCMRRSNKMKDLFLSDSKFVEDIQLCTGILITKNDNLPSSICLKCVTYLNVSLNFRRTCIHSDDSFRKLLQHIKVEVKTEDTSLDESLILKEEVEDLYNDDNDYDDNMEDVDDIKGVLDFVIQKLPKETKVSKPRPAKAKTTQVKYRSMTCITCELRFKTKQETVEHYNKVHDMLNDKLVCEVCGKQFVHPSSHYSHMRTHRMPRYCCAHCDYRASNKTDLEKHLRVHSGEKKYQCHVCPTSFRTTSNLGDHIRRHHGGAKEFACTRCDKAFFGRTKLLRHLDSHDNIKRFECEFCRSSFTRRCYWKIHLQKKHSVVTPPLRPGRRRNSNLLIADKPSVFK